LDPRVINGQCLKSAKRKSKWHKTCERHDRFAAACPEAVRDVMTLPTVAIVSGGECPVAAVTLCVEYYPLS
jgi:hypothetical protein